MLVFAVHVIKMSALFTVQVIKILMFFSCAAQKGEGVVCDLLNPLLTFTVSCRFGYYHFGL
jgi:hypothetical protein